MSLKIRTISRAGQLLAIDNLAKNPYDSNNKGYSVWQTRAHKDQRETAEV